MRVDRTGNSVASGRKSQFCGVNVSIPNDVRAFVKEERLTEADPVHSTVTMLGGVLLAVGVPALALVVDSWWLWIPAWFVAGLTYGSAMAALHEATHGSLYRSKWANDLAGVATGLVALTPYSSFRSYHFQHHVHTHAPGDAEPMIHIKSAVLYLAIVPFAIATMIPMMWVDNVRILIGHPPFYARRTGRRGLAAVTTLAALAVYGPLVVWTVADPLLVLKLVWGPLAAGLWYDSLAMSTEHYNCEFGPASAFVTSRSFETNPIFSRVLWGGHYHAAHHLCPSVTGRNLGRLHAVVRDRCEHVETSYFAFHWQTARAIARGDAGPEMPEAISHPQREFLDQIVAGDASDPEYAELAGQR